MEESQMRRATLLAVIVPTLLVVLASTAFSADRQRPMSRVHPLVGTWVLDTNTQDTEDPPALVTIGADGTIRMSDCCSAPWAGVWAPTTLRTADATILIPWADDEGGFVGFNMARADVVVSADGGSLTATYTMDIPDGEGGPSGQLGPVTAPGVRVVVEAMGEPVGPLPAAEMDDESAVSAEASPET